MRGVKRDWVGVVQGKLTVLFEAGKDSRGNYLWRCRCECGTECTKSNATLAAGTSSCSAACGIPDSNRRRAVHGMHTSPEHAAWTSMKQRCLNPDAARYDRYGGRGITVHPDWVDDFTAFYTHVGPRPYSRATLDRIDNDKGYEPGNVRWASRRQQSNNRGVTLSAEMDGVMTPLAEIARAHSIPYHQVFQRYMRGLRGTDLVVYHKTGRKRMKFDANGNYVPRK